MHIFFFPWRLHRSQNTLPPHPPLFSHCLLGYKAAKKQLFLCFSEQKLVRGVKAKPGLHSFWCCWGKVMEVTQLVCTKHTVSSLCYTGWRIFGTASHENLSNWSNLYVCWRLHLHQLQQLVPNHFTESSMPSNCNLKINYFLKLEIMLSLFEKKEKGLFLQNKVQVGEILTDFFKLLPGHYAWIVINTI